MKELYPLKFKPIFLEKIWGGEKIRTLLHKDFGDLPNCGESWEISGIQGALSVVSNGFLSGNNIEELIEIYMGDLVGERVYDKFGIEFPLLIKFIDANRDLSIQVHPNDKLAIERHQAYGKSEMWYIFDAEPGARINFGFLEDISKKEYIKNVRNNNLLQIIRYEEVKAGDAVYIPSGKVHAIGKGVLLIEIQQTSDISYRIFDYGRKDKEGKHRELHIDLALDAINFDYQKEYKSKYKNNLNKPSELISCPYFTTNVIEFDSILEREYVELDSFIIYICLEEDFKIEYNNKEELVKQGETVLVPASLNSVFLKPGNKKTKLLEVYIEN